MQTSDLNVNNTESDHDTAIFSQFQDALFSREHTSVKTLMKIFFDLLQWQAIATLSLPTKAAIASFISTTFRGYFCLRANDIARIDHVSFLVEHAQTFFAGEEQTNNCYALIFSILTAGSSRTNMKM